MQACSHLQKNLAIALLISFFVYLNCSRIVFPSSNDLNKPSSESLDYEISALLEVLVEAFLLSILKYTEEDLQQIIRTILKSQRLAVVAPAFNKCHKRALKYRVPDIYQSKFYIKYYNFCQ